MIDIENVMKARHWTELAEVGDSSKYSQMLRHLHPDINPAPGAEEAFKQVTVLWRERHETPRLTVTLASYSGFELQRSAAGQFLYTVSDKSDNDLIVRAENSYTTLEGAQAPQFFPALVGKRHSSDGRAALQLGIPAGNWWLLSDFKTLTGRDIVWIAKRVLVALINSHAVNVVHGNVNAFDVWVNPLEHGVLLGGWGASVSRGESLTLRPLHETALLDQVVGSGWLDRRAVAQMFLQYDIHEAPLRRYFESLFNYHVGDRKALALLSQAAEEAFGPPKFNKLEEPTNPKDLRIRL